MKIVNRIAVFRSCIGIVASAAWQTILFGALGEHSWIGSSIVPILYIPAGLIAFKIVKAIFEEDAPVSRIGIPAIISLVPVVFLSYFYFSRTGGHLFKQILPSLISVIVCAGISFAALLASLKRIPIAKSSN